MSAASNKEEPAVGRVFAPWLEASESCLRAPRVGLLTTARRARGGSGTVGRGSAWSACKPDRAPPARCSPWPVGSPRARLPILRKPGRVLPLLGAIPVRRPRWCGAPIARALRVSSRIFARKTRAEVDRPHERGAEGHDRCEHEARDRTPPTAARRHEHRAREPGQDHIAGDRRLRGAAVVKRLSRQSMPVRPSAQ